MMSEKSIEIVRKYNFDPKEVIAGLNGYYESDKRNGYITVRRNDIEGPAYFTAALYLSALIEWLREDHDIFYYPGMEAKKEDVWKNIMNYIRQEPSQNGFDLPEKVDGAPLSIERTFRDLIELLMKRTKEVKAVNDQRWKDLRDIYKALGCDGVYSNVDDFAKAVKARAECTKRAFGEESDTNKLIRDYCTEHDIVAPSRYLSDEACIEYLFSVSFAILQDLYRDIFKKQPDGLSAKDIATKILDWTIMLAACDRSGIALRDIYTTVASPVERRRYNIDNCDGEIVDHMKDYILRRFEGLHANTEYCLKKMSELDGCRKDLKILEDQQEFLVKQNSELATKVSAKDDEISRLKGLINAMNEEVKDM